MSHAERVQSVGLVVVATVLAAAWPLSAHAFNPLLMPAALALTAAGIVILTRPEWGLALAVALSPFINATVVYEHTALKPVQVLVPVLAVATLVYGSIVRPAKAGGRDFRSLAIGVTLLVGVALLSSAQAIDPSASINKLFLLFTATALLFAVRRVCTERREVEIVVAGVLVGLVFASVQGIVQTNLGTGEAGFFSGGEVITRVQGSFGHPNQYAGYLAFLLPLAGFVAVRAEFSGWLRSVGLTALAVGLPALYLTYARGAAIGLLLGLVLWVGLLRPRLGLGMALGGVCLLAFVALVPTPLQDRFDPSGSESDLTLREDIWNAAIDIYASQPVLGVGLSNFQVAYEQLPSTTASASQRRLLHQSQVLVPPHAQNIYLQALAEQGVIGLAALAVFLALSLLVCFRAARHSDPLSQVLGFGVGAGLLGLMIHGMLDVPLFTEALPPLFALLAATTVAIDLKTGTTPPGRGTLQRRSAARS